MTAVLPHGKRESPRTPRTRLQQREKEFENLVGSPNSAMKAMGNMVPILSRNESSDENLGARGRSGEESNPGEQRGSRSSRGSGILRVDTSFKATHTSKNELKSPTDDLLFPLSPMGDASHGSKNERDKHSHGHGHSKASKPPESAAQMPQFRFKLGQQSKHLVNTESSFELDKDDDDAVTPHGQAPGAGSSTGLGKAGASGLNANTTTATHRPDKSLMNAEKKLRETASSESISSLQRTVSGINLPALSNEGFSCGVCQSSLPGARFRCLNCPTNFDICVNCEAKGAHDKTHYLVKVPASVAQLPVTKPLPPLVANRAAWVHEGTTCQICKSTAPITGYRHFCTVCDLQICETCEFVGAHDVNHSRLKYSAPSGLSSSA